MARKRRIIVIENGAPVERLVSKPPAPRNLRVWLEACANAARWSQGGHFATRMGGQWVVYRAEQPPVWAQPHLKPKPLHIRDFPSEDAAAMYMLHKAQVAS